MPLSESPQGIFCNRTLNLRSIQAIGYDMDYTLIHYNMQAWEELAYYYLKQNLLADDWPVDELTFDPNLVMRGLILDTELGNAVKANRFGYIKKGYHGTKPLTHQALRSDYERTLVDLNEPRWFFLNTLFSISEACMYLQLVDVLDQDKLPGQMGYPELQRAVRRSLDEAHLEGKLKEDIISHPERYVDIDEEMPLTLLDQKKAGKHVLLITNSEWSYAEPMLRYAFDPYLPKNLTWRDLFDISIVSARKPDFFSVRMPAFELVNDGGLLKEHRGPLVQNKVYVGGNASLVEESLGLKGDEILYIGDHLFVDVNITKNVLRWRTALVLRELENEIEDLNDFEVNRRKLHNMMRQKEKMESRYSAMRLERQRNKHGYGPQTEKSDEDLEQAMHELRQLLVELDNRIAPIARSADQLVNKHWGPLMRTGRDKSHLARQIERYADVYTSRVSNFINYSPFAYLRSHRGSLPHDRGIEQPE